MRLDATISDPQGETFAELADMLGQSKSATAAEAMLFFVQVCQGVLQGRRVVLLDERKQVEITSPSFTALEWLRHREDREVPASAFEKMATMVADPAPPTPSLEKAAKRSVRGRRAYVHNKKG